MAQYTVCESCYQELLKACPWAADFWLNLVYGETTAHTYWFFLVDHEILQVLENKRFIVSHEATDRILFVLRGKQQNCFCIHPDDHLNLSII